MKVLEDAAVLREVSLTPDALQGPEEPSLDQVAFVFDHYVLVFTPIDDTAEVAVAEVAAGDFMVTPGMRRPGEVFDAAAAGVFAAIVGNRIDDLWRCTNSRGYDDMTVLSFGLLVPQLALLNTCSTLRVYRFQPGLRAQHAPFPVD